MERIDRRRKMPLDTSYHVHVRCFSLTVTDFRRSPQWEVSRPDQRPPTASMQSLFCPILPWFGGECLLAYLRVIAAVWISDLGLSLFFF